MKLKLERPIVFFDLETTGTDAAKDRVVEISYIKVYPDGEEESKCMRINPGCHIPEGASAVHGIYDADVANKPMFKDAATELVKVFKDCDVAGYNSNKFDVPMLAEEFLRAGVLDVDFTACKKVDVQVIYYKHEPRTLSAAYKYYCGDNLENAHSAMADTAATYEVLKAQLDKYDDMQNDVEFLDQYTNYNKNVDLAGKIVYDENNVEVISFGKYKGRSVADVFRVDPGYYSWMMQGDFALNTKQTLNRLWQKYMGK